MWQWLLFLGYFGLLLWIISRVSFFRFSQLPNWLGSAIFCLKVVAGFALYYIYTFYYTDHETSDTWKYFDDAKLIYSWFFEQREVFWRFLFGIDLSSPDIQPYVDQLHGWTNPYTYGLSHDSPTIVRINVIMMFMSGAFYPIHILFMSFLSFIGLTALVRTVEGKVSFPIFPLVILVFLAPSILFWSSGVLKEAPLMCALGLLWWSMDQVFLGKKNAAIFTVLFSSVFVMFWLKEYVLICCLPALFFLLVVQFWKGVKLWLAFAMTQILVLTFALNPGPFYPAGNLIYVLQKKQTDFYNVASATNAGSVVEMGHLASTADLFLQLPNAFCITFFRPFLGEANGAVAFVSSIENGFYLILFVTAIICLFKRPKLPATWWACLSVMLFSAIIIGNSVPVLGAVVRYKIAALPFFILWCLWPIGEVWKQKLFNDQESSK